MSSFRFFARRYVALVRGDVLLLFLVVAPLRGVFALLRGVAALLCGVVVLPKAVSAVS